MLMRYWIAFSFSSCFCYSSNEVHIKVLEREIRVGKPLHLSCEISIDVNKGSRKWFGGKDGVLLSLNGVSTNSAKYIETRVSSSKFHLRIADMDEHDLNCTYVCRFGFFADEMILSVNESNFKYFPEEDLIHVKYVRESGSYSLEVKIDQVFPVPTCIVKTTVKHSKLVEKKRNGMFYAVQFSYQSEKPFQTCGSPVEIVCTINESQFNIRHQHYVECIDSIPTSTRSNEPALFVIIAIGISSGILIVAVHIFLVQMYIMVQLYRNKPNKELTKEKVSYHSYEILKGKIEITGKAENDLRYKTKHSIRSQDVDLGKIAGMGFEIKMQQLVKPTDNESEAANIILVEPSTLFN